MRSVTKSFSPDHYVPNARFVYFVFIYSKLDILKRAENRWYKHVGFHPVSGLWMRL
jgi:hypothetical protein